MPNEKQQKFIREELIPFIKRDAGKGFFMNLWKLDTSRDDLIRLLEGRPVPSCNTVACIGGSIAILTKYIASSADWAQPDRFDPEDPEYALYAPDCIYGVLFLGISWKNSDTLFYTWDDYAVESQPWPKRYSIPFKQVKGDLVKQADIACQFLEEIAENGDDAFVD